MRGYARRRGGKGMKSDATDAHRKTRLWAPDIDLQKAVELADVAADDALKSQVLDPGDEEYGGYRSPETLICEGSGAAATSLNLTILWGTPQSRHYQDPALVESIRLALAYFEERAQYEDGSLDGFGAGDMKSAPIAAFATFSLYELLRRWEKIGHPAAPEITGRVRRAMIKSGTSLRSGRLFTHNHRWTACAAMARVNDVAPDERLVAAIDDYLSDGVDQDEDGFYAEYSMGYGMLCNYSFMTVADLLHRSWLLDHVRRNLDLLQWMYHPNGEVACEFTYRSDQGMLGPNPLFLEMAERDGNGLYVAYARAGLDLALKRNALDGMTMLKLATQEAPRVEAASLPDSYWKTFARNQIGRIRRGRLSVTVMGRPAHPTVPFLGKPYNQNFLAVRYGDAIIDGTRICYKYYGDRVVGVPEGGLSVQGDEFVVRHDFTDWVDGPIPSRHIQLSPDLHIRLGVREREGGIALSLSALGLPRVSVQLEFAVRPAGDLVIDGNTIPLKDGEHHYLTGGPVRIINGSDMLEINGDLVVRHRIIAPGKFVTQPRRTSLLVSPRTPYEGVITIRGRHA